MESRAKAYDIEITSQRKTRRVRRKTKEVGRRNYSGDTGLQCEDYSTAKTSQWKVRPYGDALCDVIRICASQRYRETTAQKAVRQKRKAGIAQPYVQ